MSPRSTSFLKASPILLAAGLALLPLPAQTPASEKPGSGVAELTAALFDAEGSADFDKTVAAARRAGIPTQTILEARFLNLVDRQDHSGIGRLAPELAAQRDKFQLADSQIFSTGEEWEAVVEYSLALRALEKEDKDGFKKHILEAFWLSPRQGVIFAPHIEQLRLEAAMAEVKLDLTEDYVLQDKVAKESLGGLAKDAPIILLHFWSPWSQECEALLEDFIATAGALSKKGVAVVSVLADPAPEILPDAKSYQRAVNNRATCSWIIDDKNNTLTRRLRVADLPTMVVLDRTGRVHFNGHPSDQKLWQALQKLDPKLQRPSLPKNVPETAP